MTVARTICLGFIAVITLGTVLLWMPFSTHSGNWNDPIVALFTSTSAVCVTGLIVVDTGSYYSFWGQLIIILLIQIGGFGYMMTSTFLMLLLRKKFDLTHKFAIQESFDRPFLQGSRNLVRSILATTLIFELTGVFFMVKVFSEEYGDKQGVWLSVFHSISAWNNAGFSLFPDSLIRYQDSLSINFIVPLLIIFGGIGYQVIIEMYLWVRSFFDKNGSRFVFSLNFRVVTSTTIFLVFLGTICIFFTEFNNLETLGGINLQTKALAAWFQSVTTRTAGFNSIEIGDMTTAGLFLTMGFMFIGASPSGTGGGIKTTTLRILTNCTRSVLRGNEEVIMYQREVPVNLILKAIAVVFGSAIMVILMTFIISFIESDFNSIQILFEVVSAFATVGLSTGITASFSTLPKLILIFTMYAGRVGILLLMAAILGEPRPSRIKYPEENLLVG